jgi:hypothetical protein
MAAAKQVWHTQRQEAFIPSLHTCIPRAVNDPPAVVRTQHNILEDTNLSLSLNVSDVDDTDLALAITRLPKYGRLFNAEDQQITTQGEAVSSPVMTYVPNQDGYGTPYDWWEYLVTDGGGLESW